MIKKAILTGSIAFLFIAVSLFPVTAMETPVETIEVQEATVVEKFMDSVERIATESQSFSEFSEKLCDLCQSTDYGKFPIIREFINKILCSLINQREFYIGGININSLLEKIALKTHPDFFVISYGAYHRLNPRKENSIARFKEGLSLWRYTDVSMLLKGRTLILERQPFGIHQKMVGPQLGIMKGFKGLYIDIESKLTGNSYVFFMGRAHRIRTFDLTPLKK